MNREQAIKKIDEVHERIEELRKFISDGDQEKNYYFTVVTENHISHLSRTNTIYNDDVVYEDENVIIEYNGAATYISYKNGKKP